MEQVEDAAEHARSCRCGMPHREQLHALSVLKGNLRKDPVINVWLHRLVCQQLMRQEDADFQAV